MTPPSADAPAVCVLDTGVTRGHPLLEDSLDPADCHACDPAWRTRDHLGHGTEMAGLALYGDLTPVLASTQKVVLRHRLESVKILPPHPHPANPPELYGAITAEAVSRAEIQAPARPRTSSMSIAATDERDRGQPTSWSAAIDALAAGRSFDPSTQGLDYLDEGDDSARRLFVVCAGNIDETALSVDHLARNDTDPIHDPGQAWNAPDAPLGKIQKFDVVVARNYLTEHELAQLSRLVNAYLDVAESMALRKIPMTMQDWETRLSRFLDAPDHAVLADAGKVTAEIAKAHAEAEFEKYRIVQDRLFESDFDRVVAETKRSARTR